MLVHSNNTVFSLAFAKYKILLINIIRDYFVKNKIKTFHSEFMKDKHELVKIDPRMS